MLQFHSRMTVEGKQFAAVLRATERQNAGAMMLEMILERAFHPDALNALFKRSAERQYTHELLFSTLVDLMLLVVLDKRNSVHRGYLSMRDEIGVSLRAVYDKLARTETAVSEELVKTVAERCAEIIDSMPGSLLASPLGDIPLIIADGNHLAHTHRRIDALRTSEAAALPGFSLALLDPQRMLLRSIVAETDAHAGERSRMETLAERVNKGECLVADRHFCTRSFLQKLQAKRAYFVIREHANIPLELQGERVLVKANEDAMIYEQAARVLCEDSENDKTVIVRRVTIELRKPTRKGDVTLHILTNVAHEAADAELISGVYRRRWTIEAMFQQLEGLLQSEVETLGYPKAALFAFAVGVCGFNVLSTLRAALRSAHEGEQTEAEVSAFHVAEQARTPWRGLRVLLLAAGWCVWHRVALEEFTTELLRLAAIFPMPAVRKAVRGPKKEPPPKSEHVGERHVSTQRILAQRKAKSGRS
jgi:hypothetical protein